MYRVPQDGGLRFHFYIDSNLQSVDVTGARVISERSVPPRRFGLEAGLSVDSIDKIAAGQRPKLDSDEIIYNFCDELLNTRRVTDATFNRAKERFGERGIVDLIGVMGYYHLVSMALNVDRYPLPEGAKDQLQTAK